ncbi:hypothetical protein TWF718_008456 [Orbilia javanica]|uniref:Uncharacterized protein n=1 Tax=Orbilia javanica TaxID=47235 RepID=A0AAN8N5D1_9PEZI
MGDQEHKTKIKTGKKKKIVQKPLVVSDVGKLCSITVADSSTSASSVEGELDMKDEIDSANVDTMKEDDVKIEGENESDSSYANQTNQDGDNGLDAPRVESKSYHEQINTHAQPLQKTGGITPVKRTVGRKPKAIKVEEASEVAETKVKGKRGRKRKQNTVEETREVVEEAEPKPKRGRNSSTLASKGSKKSGSKLSSLQLPSPPPTPPPPTEAELAEAAAKATAESARKERLKLIPYYYEEMKEIFDYLCDRGVYWKSDLPRNKRYSNRDTKLLEKEVKKRVSEILKVYPKEEEVMKEFEEEEQKLRVLERQ